MKKLYVIGMLICCGFSGASQELPPEMLNTTWYYYGYEVDLGGFVVFDVSPPTNPTIYIEEDMTFFGTCACNEFDGQFYWDAFEDVLHVAYMNRTYNQCQYQSHTDLADDYFSWFSAGEHFYFPAMMGDFMTLVGLNGFGPWFVDNPPLNNKDILQEEVHVTYKSSGESLELVSPLSIVQKLNIIGIDGKMILSATPKSNYITYDLGVITEGIYMVEILTSDGRKVVKKFLKY